MPITIGNYRFRDNWLKSKECALKSCKSLECKLLKGVKLIVPNRSCLTFTYPGPYHEDFYNANHREQHVEYLLQIFKIIYMYTNRIIRYDFCRTTTKHCQFLTNRIFYFWQHFRFLGKFSLFENIVVFWQNFWQIVLFLATFSIFGNIFYFWQNFHLWQKFCLFYKIFAFLQNLMTPIFSL